MSFTRKKVVAPAAIVLALSLTPMLAGCGGGGNPIQGMINQATGGQVDIGGTEVPKSFPSEIPLVSGSVISGSSINAEDTKIWNVAIKASDPGAVNGIDDQLKSAGFESLGEGLSSEDGSSKIFTKEPYGVLVIVGKDDGGFVVNYTVTYTTPDN